MRHSIRYKMIAILVAIIGSVLFLTWFLNIAFAERYYILSEKTSIINTFEEVQDCLNQADENSDDDSFTDDLEQITNISNVKMMVAKADTVLNNQTVIFSNMSDGTRTYEEILGYLNQIRNQVSINLNNMSDSDRNSMNSWLIKNDMTTLVNKGYYVTQMRDKFTGKNGIYLFGFTDNDYFVAMRVSIEGIRTSLRISSRFMAYMSLIGVVLGIFVISFYACRFTDPIKEMAQVANRMTELDFEARVRTNSQDEIGELGNSINKLSEALETTIADLKSANLELQQDIQKKEEVDEMRKEFLSHVSHELKTPIAIIQGYAEGLKDGITDDKESMDFYCDVIMDESKKMNQMVRKLLTLNQLEFGTTPLSITRFDLQQLISNKLASSSILFGQSDAQISFEEKKPVYVWADEYMIEEVFTNYLTNALNHVKHHGQIRIWFERMGQVLRTSVYNEGNQIPQEELEKLWIKFYKVDKARTREYGGNGIGLSIVAAAMSAHNKDFGVYNVDDGVVFYFDVDCESINQKMIESKSEVES